MDCGYLTIYLLHKCFYILCSAITPCYQTSPLVLFTSQLLTFYLFTSSPLSLPAFFFPLYPFGPHNHSSSSPLPLLHFPYSHSHFCFSHTYIRNTFTTHQHVTTTKVHFPLPRIFFFFHVRHYYLSL